MKSILANQTTCEMLETKQQKLLITDWLNMFVFLKAYRTTLIAFVDCYKVIWYKFVYLKNS